MAVGVVFVAFGYVAVGFEQGDGAVEVVVGDVVGRGGIGRVGYHKEGLVEIVAIGVIALGDVGAVRLGQDAPAIIIIAGGDGQGWSVVILDFFDAAAQGVVGVVGEGAGGVGDAGEAVFVVVVVVVGGVVGEVAGVVVGGLRAVDGGYFVGGGVGVGGSAVVAGLGEGQAVAEAVIGEGLVMVGGQGGDFGVVEVAAVESDVVDEAVKVRFMALQSVMAMRRSVPLTLSVSMVQAVEPPGVSSWPST